MDALTTLPIKKHTALLNRFPETRFVTQLAKKTCQLDCVWTLPNSRSI